MKYSYAIYKNRVYRFPDKAARDAFVWDYQAKPRTRAIIKYALKNAQPWEIDDATGGEFVIKPGKGEL